MVARIALLRGVNVGGHKRLRMEDLCILLERMGFENVDTIAQSGNVVFSDHGGSEAELEVALERAARKKLGLETDFLVRTREEWNSMMAHNPFTAQARENPSHVLVYFLKEGTTGEKALALEKGIRGPEMVSLWGQHLYAYYPQGIGRSKLTLAVIEKRLGTKGTARNWNTISDLAQVVSR